MLMNGQVHYQFFPIQRPLTSDPKDWGIYWRVANQAWRTRPDIGVERQEELAERLTIKPQIEKGLYPFKDFKLGRADIEWLLATRQMRSEPLDRKSAGEDECERLDLRGADLRGEDLSG